MFPPDAACCEKTFFSETYSAQILHAEGSSAAGDPVKPENIFQVAGINRRQRVGTVYVGHCLLSLDRVQSAGWDNEGPAAILSCDGKAFFVHVAQAQTQCFS
jgi:hypothetical protein